MKSRASNPVENHSSSKRSTGGKFSVGALRTATSISSRRSSLARTQCSKLQRRLNNSRRYHKAIIAIMQRPSSRFWAARACQLSDQLFMGHVGDSSSSSSSSSNDGGLLAITASAHVAATTAGFAATPEQYKEKSERLAKARVLVSKTLAMVAA